MLIAGGGAVLDLAAWEVSGCRRLLGLQGYTTYLGIWQFHGFVHDSGLL